MDRLGQESKKNVIWIVTSTFRLEQVSTQQIFGNINSGSDNSYVMDWANQFSANQEATSRRSDNFSTSLFCSNLSMARNCSISSLWGSRWDHDSGRYWTRIEPFLIEIYCLSMMDLRYIKGNILSVIHSGWFEGNLTKSFINCGTIMCVRTDILISHKNSHLAKELGKIPKKL